MALAPEQVTALTAQAQFLSVEAQLSTADKFEKTFGVHALTMKAEAGVANAANAQFDGHSMSVAEFADAQIFSGRFDNHEEKVVGTKHQAEAVRKVGMFGNNSAASIDEAGAATTPGLNNE